MGIFIAFLGSCIADLVIDLKYGASRNYDYLEIRGWSFVAIGKEIDITICMLIVLYTIRLFAREAYQEEQDEPIPQNTESREKTEDQALLFDNPEQTSI